MAKSPDIRFRVSNPSPKNYPEWTPHPFPLSATNGGLTLVLRSLKAAAGPHPYMQPEWEPAALPDLPWSKSHVRIKAGKDATGNETMSAALAPTEKAWPVQLEVDNAEADLKEPFRITLPSIPVSRSGFYSEVPVPRNVAMPGPTKILLNHQACRAGRP